MLERLDAAGAVDIGRLNMAEFAAGPTGHNKHWGDCRNPWNPAHMPGGSSSGSGAAVAARLVPGALGSDTGGSIRLPSAADGVTGLKATWGRVSRHGCFELAASLDHIGPMCRSANDAAIMLGAIAGPDADDPTTLRAEVPDYQASDDRDLRGFRVGLDEGYALAKVEPEVRRAVEAALRVMRALGANIVPMTFPDVDAAVADWPMNCAVETAVAHASTFPSRRAEYGPGLAGFIDAGRGLSGMDYQRILLRRREFAGRVQRALDAVDVMLIPAIPFTVPTVQRMATLGQVPSDLAALIRFTAP
jgi:amidase